MILEKRKRKKSCVLKKKKLKKCVQPLLMRIPILVTRYLVKRKEKKEYDNLPFLTKKVNYHIRSLLYFTHKNLAYSLSEFTAILAEIRYM